MVTEQEAGNRIARIIRTLYEDELLHVYVDECRECKGGTHGHCQRQVVFSDVLGFPLTVTHCKCGEEIHDRHNNIPAGSKLKRKRAANRKAKGDTDQ
jgi:hypothetical protein